MKFSFSPLISLIFVNTMFVSGMAKAGQPLWIRCTAENRSEEEGRVHLTFSNMLIGSVSITGSEFIKSLVAWDSSDELDPSSYDKIGFNSGLDFGCESYFENSILQSVQCGHKQGGDLDIRANYMKGINPSSTVTSRVYGRLNFDLKRQPNELYVMKVDLGSGLSERDNFIFTQNLTNLKCESSDDN
ncbi:MAG: hypothetical protein NTV34_18685 [Proteobacteria bacterium]|nr:hypothetical protein [Pseudomonadota bacterium]